MKRVLPHESPRLGCRRRMRCEKGDERTHAVAPDRRMLSEMPRASAKACSMVQATRVQGFVTATRDEFASTVIIACGLKPISGGTDRASSTAAIDRLMESEARAI